MTKRFRAYAPDQLEVMPRSLAELLPEDHLAFFVSDVIDQMDVAESVQGYGQVGGPAYEPRMMLKLLVYAYVTGEYSSRQIQRRIREEIAYRYLAGGYQPTYKAISEFRRKNLKSFRGLFLQLLVMAQDLGLVKLGHVAIDGSKLRANASKHKAMSYGRRREAEAKLRAEVQAWFARAAAADAEDQPAAADLVHRRGLLGDAQRIAQRQHLHGDADLHALRARGDGAGDGQRRRQHGALRRGVQLGQPHHIQAAAFRDVDLFEGDVESLGLGLSGHALKFVEHTKFHWITSRSLAVSVDRFRQGRKPRLCATQRRTPVPRSDARARCRRHRAPETG